MFLSILPHSHPGTLPIKKRAIAQGFKTYKRETTLIEQALLWGTSRGEAIRTLEEICAWKDTCTTPSLLALAYLYHEEAEHLELPSHWMGNMMPFRILNPRASTFYKKAFDAYRKAFIFEENGHTAQGSTVANLHEATESRRKSRGVAHLFCSEEILYTLYCHAKSLREKAMFAHFSLDKKRF